MVELKHHLGVYAVRQQLRWVLVFALTLVLCLWCYESLVRWPAKLREIEEMGMSLLYTSPRPMGHARQYGLELRGPVVNDESIDDILRCSLGLGLRHHTVVLKEAAITDAGLGRLCMLQDIEVLIIEDCPRLLGEQFGELNCLPMLRHLDLHVGRSGIPLLARLEEMVRLRELQVSIGDASVQDLLLLDNIQSISVDGSRLSESGLLRLQQVRNLRYLGVMQSTVSRRVLEQFQRARPDVKIFVEQDE